MNCVVERPVERANSNSSSASGRVNSCLLEKRQENKGGVAQIEPPLPPVVEDIRPWGVGMWLLLLLLSL